MRSFLSVAEGVTPLDVDSDEERAPPDVSASGPITSSSLIDILKSMSLDKVNKRQKETQMQVSGLLQGMAGFETFVREWLQDLEARVAESLSAHDWQLDDVRARLDSRGEEHDKLAAEVKRMQSELEETKAAINELRGTGAGAPYGSTAATSATTATTLPTGAWSGYTPSTAKTAQEVRQRFRLVVRGWAPYGSAQDKQISSAQTKDVQREINRNLSPEQQLEYVYEEPFLRNYQFHVRLPLATNSDDAFAARAALQRVVEQSRIRVNGSEIQIRVEPSTERKAWLRVFFSNLKAVSELIGEGKEHIQTEMRTFAFYHRQHAHRPLARLDKRTSEMVFSEEVLLSVGLTPDAIRAHVGSQ